MENKIEVIGSENSIIYKNLNEQFLSIKKVIITKEILLSSLEDLDLREYIENLKNLDYGEFKKEISNEKLDYLFSNLNFKKDFFKLLSDKLSILSNDLNVNIKNFNFVNSVSNTKYEVVLRTKDFSQSIYFTEKGEILTAIKYLIRRYLSFNGNYFRLNKLDEFQIEIFPSKIIQKKVFIKKEYNEVLIYASIGFSQLDPIDFIHSGEIYFSKSDKFLFFKNCQNSAILREHNKLLNQTINKVDKILEPDELIKINDLLRNINDALIEININQKGLMEIVNLSYIDNKDIFSSENGLLYYKSSNNFNKISLVTLRDNLEEDLINPRYLLIRDSNDLFELLKELNKLELVDGLIFTFNFYHQFFEYLGKKLDIDILFINKHLDSSLEVKLDLENLDIISEKINKISSNPFENIINKEMEEKKKIVDHLSNIDLSTPKKKEIKNDKGIENLAESLISSSSSSVNSSSSTVGSLYDSSGKKKSAIAMLAEAALNRPKPNEKQSESPIQKENKDNLNQNIETDIEEKDEENNYGKNNNFFEEFDNQKEAINKEISNDNYNDNNESSYFNNLEQTSNFENTQTSLPFNNFSESNEEVNLENNLNKELDFEIESEKIEEKIEVKRTEFKISKEEIEKYNDVLATNIITGTIIENSNSYFIDTSLIEEFENKGKLFLTLSEVDNLNQNLNYLVPISLYEENLDILKNKKNIFVLLNSIEEFFLLRNFENIKVFFNLSAVTNDDIKKNIILDIFEKSRNPISLIISKEELNLLEKDIEKIENLYIYDLEDENDFEVSKEKVLSFEKKFLFEKLKNY
jgi:hypothetical protein